MDERIDGARVGVQGMTPCSIAADLQGSRRRRATLTRALSVEVVRAANGVLRAWGARYRRSPNELRNDVVQEVMVTLFTNDGATLRKWDPKRAALPSYLRGIVYNHVRDLFRSNRRNPFFCLFLEDAGAEPSFSVETDELLHQLWLWEVRDRLLAAEDARGRSLYRALVVEGRDATEVGRMHGMSRDAVYQWLARFKKRAKRFVQSKEIR